MSVGTTLSLSIERNIAYVLETQTWVQRCNYHFKDKVLETTYIFIDRGWKLPLEYYTADIKKKEATPLKYT